MRIATITPVRNDAADLPSAIASIQRQAGVAVDTIVIAVGPSDDDSRAVADRLAAADIRIRVIDNPSGRTPEALNLAVEAAGAVDVIVRVDARAVLPDDYIANAVETLAASGAGNVGAVQRPVGTTPVERGIAAAMASTLGSGGAGYRHGGEARRVDTAWMGVFRRDALVDVGGFDEMFIRNQDAELNLRLARAGHEVWLDPRLVVDYRPRPTLRKLARQYYEYGWWRFRTIRRHPGSAAPRQLAAPVIVVGLAGSALGAATITPWCLVVPAGYAAVVAASAAATDGPLAQRAVTAAALPTMHLSWGTGFLVSAVRSISAR